MKEEVNIEMLHTPSLWNISKDLKELCIKLIKQDENITGI